MVFYKETAFKQTPIGRIPYDWDIVDAVDYVDILKGYAFSSEFFNGKKEGMPLIRIRDLGKTETESYYSGEYDPTYIVRNGDILISMDGEFNVYLWNGPEGLLNQRVCKVSSKDITKLNNCFLFYALQKPVKTIESQISQTTVKHLLDRDLERIKIPFPSFSEQKMIAEVLGVVDSAVGLVDRVILKTERLKKGLMQTLLTRGIGHKEYKQTPIGTIPKEWQIVKLGDLVKIQGGYAFKSTDYVKNGVPLIRIANVSFGDIELKDLAKLPYSYLDEYNEFVLKENDIVIVLTRPIIEGGIKAGRIKKEHIPALLNQRVGRLRIIDETKILPDFLFHIIFSDNFVEQVKRSLVTMNQPNISPYEMEKFKIPLPPLSEQEKIAKILSATDQKIRLERNEKSRLERIEQGLMDLLLTGKIRVKVD